MGVIAQDMLKELGSNTEGTGKILSQSDEAEKLYRLGKKD